MFLCGDMYVPRAGHLNTLLPLQTGKNVSTTTDGSLALETGHPDLLWSHYPYSETGYPPTTYTPPLLPFLTLRAGPQAVGVPGVQEDVNLVLSGWARTGHVPRLSGPYVLSHRGRRPLTLSPSLPIQQCVSDDPPSSSVFLIPYPEVSK